MYLYFDRNGTLKEQINPDIERVGNIDINTLYIYVEGLDYEEITGANFRFRLQDDSYIPSKTAFFTTTDEPIKASIPYDKKQDLKYFKYGVEYDFIKFTIPDEVLDNSGSVLAYTWLTMIDLSVLGLGGFTFNVDGDNESVAPDTNITISNFNMLMAKINEQQLKIIVKDINSEV